MPLRLLWPVVCFLWVFTHVAVADVEKQWSWTESSPYQGFGATTRGGSGGEIVVVSNLNDSGPGSLRAALSRGRRFIQFGIGGEIALKSRLHVKGASITLDGFSAPWPGITLRNYGLRISGDKGAHDIIVRGIRVRLTSQQPGVEDGITISHRASHVVIDHVSISGASDESIGIVSGAHDVTVAWSILATPFLGHHTNMLVFSKATRLSIHHNLFFEASRRNPWVAYNKAGERAPELQADVRNNVMWDVSGAGTDHGTVIFDGGTANIVNNYYKAVASKDASTQKRVIVVCGGKNRLEELFFCWQGRRPAAGAYVTGNVSHDGWTDYINTKGTRAQPFPAPSIGMTDACTAAHQVVASAGVRPLDALDTRYLSQIFLRGCDKPHPPP